MMDLFMYISLGISGFAALLLLLNIVRYLTGRPYVGEDWDDDGILLWVLVLLIPFVNTFLLGLATAFGLVVVLGWAGENIRRRSIACRSKKRDEGEAKEARNAADAERRRHILSQQRYAALKVEDVDRVVVSEKKPSWEEIDTLAGAKEEE